MLSGIAACGGNDVRTTCDEPQPYQSGVTGKKIEVPEDLEPLDELKEMPIPKAATPPRPEGAPCVEYPPSVNPSS
jgi:hypothetical protein